MLSISNCRTLSTAADEAQHLEILSTQDQPEVVGNTTDIMLTMGRCSILSTLFSVVFYYANKLLSVTIIGAGWHRGARAPPAITNGWARRGTVGRRTANKNIAKYLLQ